MVNYGSGMNKTTTGLPPTPDTELARKINNALIVKGVSVHRLSEDTGITYPTLRRSLKGQRSLTFNEFGRIAHALDVEPSYLLPESLASLAA